MRSRWNGHLWNEPVEKRRKRLAASHATACNNGNTVILNKVFLALGALRGLSFGFSTIEQYTRTCCRYRSRGRNHTRTAQYNWLLYWTQRS